MSWLARMEEACAAFIERTFAKTFPSDLEPAQIARRLVATMETRTAGEGRSTAPSRYVVFVHSADFERLQPHRDYLEREWSALLQDMAQRVGIRFSDGSPRVELNERAGMVPGAMEIETAGATPPRERVATSRRFRLRMVKGVPPDAVYDIDRTLTVGRSDDRDIFLVDPGVSRNHAVVAYEGDVPVVLDMGSKNGTFVNGERVTTQELRNGDLVRFAGTELRLEASEG